MTEYTPDQTKALEIAHNLADMGAPIFSAFRNSSVPLDARMPFLLPNDWQHTKPGTHGYIDRWRPGMALAMVCGVVFDVLDVDPRNGGNAGFDALNAAGAWPSEYAEAASPSEGRHYLIARTHLAKGKPAEGIDLQAGDDAGNGRGFIFLAPTVRISRYGAQVGQEVPYRWAVPPTHAPEPSAGEDTRLRTLIDLCTAPKRPAPRPLSGTSSATTTTGDHLFDGPEGTPWRSGAADAAVAAQLQRTRTAKQGEVNNALGGAARMLGRFVAGGYLTAEDARQALEDALADGGVHSDSWNAAHGAGWTAATVIEQAFERAATEPWTVAAEQSPGAPGTAPALTITSAADMAYWLRDSLGQGRLAGFFLRSGQVVHTPRVNEEGYVPARPGEDNGPAEIRPVAGETLAAKIQYLYRCEKSVDLKDDAGKKTGETAMVPALFPAVAAKTAVAAPEAMEGLRALRGITMTPMLRSDGTVLDRPGYDAASGYLYLPSGGQMREVPATPSALEVQGARDLLLRMVADFPFGTAEDRANYLGLLLTPIIREVAPPAYKMFGIGAHQPGSGKSLLAQIAATIHGGVLRSEVPQDEPEWSKQTASILSSTSAPVIVLDNVTGVLRSSVLAGLLTSSGEMSQRELGKSSDLRFTNDRVWVVTGNNLSLGGDLVRRTVLITIDPDMANPETRTDFAIKDLAGWVAENRTEVLWALLVMARAWVVAGRPCPARKQSDSFAHWERTVAGILACAGVPGEFDQESGKQAAAGGDDDGLAQVLSHLVERFGDRSWTVAEALRVHDGLMAGESRDWVPGPVLDKLARSEASGRKAMGWWLRNRIGRWVTDEDGTAYVIRASGLVNKVGSWRVERR